MNHLAYLITWLLAFVSFSGVVLQILALRTVHRELRVLSMVSEASRIAAAMFFDSQVARTLVLGAFAFASIGLLAAPVFEIQFGYVVFVRLCFLIAATNLLRLSIADSIRRQKIARLMKL